SQKTITEDDAWGIALFDKWDCQNTINSLRSEGIYTPPSLQGSLMYPGYPGGSNWGGVSVDEERQIIIANVNQIGAIVRLIPRDKVEAEREEGRFEGWQLSPMHGTPYAMARRPFLSMLGLPCLAPPWGKLMAVDLKSSTILWEKPLGTIEELAPAIVPNFEFGTPNAGGSITTATGLTFIGAAMDYYIRAFDTKTGEKLWQKNLPRSGMATPMTYEYQGRQYVVIAAGGHGGMGGKPGDFLVAFALQK
ncbi:MAG: PQQ-binding-like beta-propeller repeat protein, partial [Proteobacteria bacterium]|nr:PQQ-binding-like beta-propeller repeat protein [Pseudomonadota bacterium]